MATYTFRAVPAWGSPGQFARIGLQPRKSFPVTLPGGGAATVVQDGVTQVGFLLADDHGLIPEWTTTDIISVDVDFGLGPMRVDSNEAITAGASSAAAAASSATDAANSADAAANSATAAANSAAATAGKVDKGTLILYVKDYGAVGDGTTDDTAAIQSALTAARAAKARLRFEYGKTYIVSGLLNPLGVRIEGFGATLKIKPGTTQNYALFQPGGAFAMSDLTIDLNKANTTDPGVDTQGMALYAFGSAGWAGQIVLRDVQVINGYQIGVRFATGSAATDAVNVPTARAYVDGLVVDGCKWGVWVKGCAGVTLTNPRVTGSAADGIYDYLSRDTQILGGSSSGNGGHGVVSQYGHGTEIHGVSVYTNGGDGIAMGGGSTTLTQGRFFSLIGNKARGNTLHGITVDPTKSGSGTVVVPVHGVVDGNTVLGNTLHGINVTNGQHIAMNGNVCQGNVGSGIGIAGHSVALSGNVCTGNDRGIAMYGNTSFPNYGSHRVGLNVVSPNTTSTYYVESASVTGVKFASYTATAPE